MAKHSKNIGKINRDVKKYEKTWKNKDFLEKKKDLSYFHRNIW